VSSEDDDVLFDAWTKEIFALIVLLLIRSNDISHDITIICAVTVCVREGWRW
jgi:hypothetical protein